MHIVCLDMEGVLVPEIWIAFAEETGIDAFRRTTRDEPDYDKLMRYRLDLLRQHGLRLPDIPFRADAASIVLQEPITLMKAAPTATQIARLLAVDDAGTERLLGEFTFHHTRTLPGPGAW